MKRYAINHHNDMVLVNVEDGGRIVRQKLMPYTTKEDTLERVNSFLAENNFPKKYSLD